jgi:hypothetical protein
MCFLIHQSSITSAVVQVTCDEASFEQVPTVSLSNQQLMPVTSIFGQCNSFPRGKPAKMGS